MYIKGKLRMGKKEEKLNVEKKQKYLFELQKFLDLADNMEDNKLKNKIIYQMIECSKSLLKLVDKSELI